MTDSLESICKSKPKSNWLMERRHHSQSHSQRQQRRNHFSSSSSSSNQSRSNNRFSFPKSSSSSSSSSANDVRDRRRETQEEKQEEAIVGTCPFMCPGKVPNLLHITIFNLLFIIHLSLFIHSFPLIWFNNFIIVLLQTDPEAERLQRQRLRDLAVFERLHGDPRNSSPALAVKKVAYFHFKLVLLLLC